MRDTIKNHKDFLMTDDNPVAKSAFFFVRMKPAVIPDKARYGLIATKKTFKFAVQRNLAKRKLRDCAPREDGRSAMVRALVYLKKHPTPDDAE